MKHILIMVQDPVLLKNTEQALIDDFHLMTELSGDDPAKILEKYQPDIVLVELAPDYLQKLHRIMELSKTSQLPVILLYEGNDLVLQDKALALGVSDIVTGPYSKTLLIHRLRTQLELAEFRNSESEAESLQDAISFSFAELVEFRDESTGGHLKNTTLYFKLLLEEMLQQQEYRELISDIDLKALIRSAHLHDIGKIGINDEVLRKASPLNNDEFEYMKTHTTLGKQAFERIIKETGGSSWLNLAKDIAYSHHERWDGSGYPKGLKGEEIPLYARMMSIADVYDALTSKRSYKRAFTHKNAMDIILEGRGTLFDPKLVDIFEKVSDKFEKVLNSKGKDA